MLFQNLEEYPPERGGDVDALVQDDEVDVALLEFVGQVDDVLEGLAQAGGFGDDQLIVGSVRALRETSPGRRTSLPLASAMKTRSQPAAVSASGESLGAGRDRTQSSRITNRANRDVNVYTSLITAVIGCDGTIAKCLMNSPLLAKFITDVGMLRRDTVNLPAEVCFAPCNPAVAPTTTTVNRLCRRGVGAAMSR